MVIIIIIIIIIINDNDNDDNQSDQMPLVAAPASAAGQAIRKPSLKEQPSYLKVVMVMMVEVEVAVVVVMIMMIMIVVVISRLIFQWFKLICILQEVSVALHRGEELKKLKERLSAAKLIMDKDPSAKPWMLSRSYPLPIT